MIVAMSESATEEQIQRVLERLVNLGYEVHRSTGAQQTVLGVVPTIVLQQIRSYVVSNSH